MSDDAGTTLQHGAQSRAPAAAVLSIDAMGGDLGPEVVVAGMALAIRTNPDIRFLVHGDRSALDALIARRRGLSDHCDVRHATGVVAMTDKPSQILRTGRETSMWSAVEAVRSGEATVCVSCGNTGALMAVSMIRLRKLPGVNRPAIAILWPSRNPSGFNVMLDVGADIRADPDDLVQYALMGMSYARNGLGVERPRVGLLNVGTEETKGRTELKDAHDLIEAVAEFGAARHAWTVFEGGGIPCPRHPCHYFVVSGDERLQQRAVQRQRKLLRVGDACQDVRALWKRGLDRQFAVELGEILRVVRDGRGEIEDAVPKLAHLPDLVGCHGQVHDAQQPGQRGVLVLEFPRVRGFALRDLAALRKACGRVRLAGKVGHGRGKRSAR